MEQSQLLTETLGPEPPPRASERFIFQAQTLAATPPAPSGSCAVPVVPPALFDFTPPPDRVASPKAQDVLPDYGRAYFHQLLTQYWTLPTNDADPSACIHFNLQAIALIYDLVPKYKNGQLTWEDLYELETALLCVLPEAMLRSQAWVLRARFRDTVPPAEFRWYQQSKSVSMDDANLPTETLRAELETLLGEMQKYRTLVPSIAPGRLRFSRRAAVSLVGGALVVAGVAAILHFVPLATGAALALTGLTVAASGGAGGWFSEQNRLQTAIARRMAFVDKTETGKRQFSPSLAACLGAFFALLLFFAFRGHALQGIVFPEASQAALSHPFPFGLLMLWSFVAGFAERLVPKP